MPPVDTTSMNAHRQDFSDRTSVWLFGYGSLIHKVDFAYLERRQASIQGWQRRFWQGSHDHRGSPEAPGRVLTLIREPGHVCTGMAYRITPDQFEHLDHREKNGYLRFEVDLQFAVDHHADGIVYIAKPGNEAWLGPASDSAIARQIAQSSGPSGPNRDYLLQLADALRAMDVHDPHVHAVETALLQLSNNDLANF